MNHLPLTSLFNWIFYLNEKKYFFIYISSNNKLKDSNKKIGIRSNKCTNFHYDMSSQRIEWIKIFLIKKKNRKHRKK
jgi:hypothetical protein